MNTVVDYHSKKGPADFGIPSSVLTALITPLRARRLGPRSWASPSIRRKCNFGIIVFLVTILLLITSKPVLASNLSCDNRYVALVNPVRSRSLWSEQSLKPIDDQYKLVSERNFAATWLLQYDVLNDHDLLTTIQNFDSRQEKGVFLEASADLAKDAKVLYPQQTPWFKPNAVFLSGYSQSDRRKLIDTIFAKHRKIFGEYPKSVGAWWIDSYSLQYMRKKYDLKVAMIVADQLSTDNYGVWGQWWGVPYFASQANILEPDNHRQGVAIIQWAQRDPLRAFGDSKNYSNYSLQANDYITQGLDTDYFKEISSIYLDCSHQLGQITVGLETGQESVPFIREYENQLNYLKSLPSLKSVTMAEFVRNTHSLFPDTEKISYQNSNWELSTKGRTNSLLKEQINYNQNLSFGDYFVADHQGFLDRKLPIQNKDVWYFPFWILVEVIGIVFFIKKKIPWVGVTGILFAGSSYGLVLDSYLQYGWKVYFGPIVEWLTLVQIGLLLVGFLVALGWWKLVQRNRDQSSRYRIFLPVLVFGLDPILEYLRYTSLNDTRFIGFITDPYHFVGLSFGKTIQFINQDFSAQIASALLKFDFQRIWSNTWGWLIIYPLVHLLIAFCLLLILKILPKTVRYGILLILAVLWILFILNLLSTDPSFVKPITQSGLLY